MSDPYEGASFCKDCGEEVFTSLEAVSGACLACSGFASIEEYEADFDKHFCFDDGFDDIPHVVVTDDDEDFEPNESTEMFCDWGDEEDEIEDAEISAANWCECGLPRAACHRHSQDA